MTQAKRLDPRAITAALDWWREAGVDCDFTADATDWLAAEPLAEAKAVPQPLSMATPTAAAPPPPQEIDLLGANPPADLAAFRDWWLSEPALDGIGPRGRVPPRGEAGARLMVLVMDPEEGDSEQLLSAAQGRLLARMLEAMGISPEDAYFASALPRHTPMSDGHALAAQGFSAVLQHHIKLAAPQVVLVLGTNILPLLGHEAAQEPAALEKFDHEGFSVPLIAAEGLDAMMAMPRLKARFWRRWLEWTGKPAQ